MLTNKDKFLGKKEKGRYGKEESRNRSDSQGSW